MVLADYPTNPKYSIGKAKRKPLYEFTNTPGPIYSQDNTANLKYHSEQKWKIGDSKRPPLYTNERYDYYNYPYDETTELGAIKKKWKHIPGGAATLDPRIKYDFNEKVPGPGRYEPNYTTQLKREPAYHLGLKLNSGSSLSLSTGTGINVAPWTYNQDKVDKLSVHKSFPVYSFQKDKRKGLNEKIWTKNESYYLYSSIETQIMTHKPTMPIESIGNETREKRNKTGVFKFMMERVPQSVKIPMPKF